MATQNHGATSQRTLNTTSFTPFKVAGREKTSSTCSIFTLEQPSLSGNILQEMWNKGVWSIEIKQPQLQIARAYTPLPPVDPTASQNQLRLLVRKEHRGEMSNYIHNTPLNANLELRGPAVELELPRNARRIVFLAGGTGIAPAMQIAYNQREAGDCDMSILWANRRREDCQGGENDMVKSSTESWLSALKRRLSGGPQNIPSVIQDSSSENAIVRQLNQMKSTSKSSLHVDCFVDEEGTFIRPHDVETALLSKSDTNTTASQSYGENIVFVSGPEGFLSYWAGPKVWKDGREAQGPLGGALSRMNLDGWKVVKL